MSCCIVVSQWGRSKLRRGTQKELYKIVKCLANEGVKDFYTMGLSQFEEDFSWFANLTFSDKNVYCRSVFNSLITGINENPSEERIALLGEWAKYNEISAIPAQVIEKVTCTLVEMSDYIIAGMEYPDDMVAAVEYGRSLGKTVFKVFA